MSTAILYAGRYGTTEKCVGLLKSKLNDEVKIFNLQEDGNPDVSGFDNIIVGGSIHVGAIQKEVKTYVECHRELLLSKKTGLFICCMEKKEVKQYFYNAFPNEILDHSEKNSWFGGEVLFSKYNFLVKFMMRIISKSKKDVHNIQEKNISDFAEYFNNPLDS